MMRHVVAMTPVSRACVLLLSCFLWLSCSATPRAAADELTVAAAASLTDVVDALGIAFEAETGISIRASYSSSAIAARQVISGASFDVLLSANRLWIDEVRKRGAIDSETITSFASNRLVIAGSTGVDIADGPGTLLNVAVRKGWRIAIADPGSVPAGIYAREALEALGLWAGVRPLLVPLQNVRSVVTYIDRAETPIGIVYATDLRVARNARRATTFDPALHSPIEYTGAVTRFSPSPALAQSFLEFVTSPGGQTIIASHGFVPKEGTGS